MNCYPAFVNRLDSNKPLHFGTQGRFRCASDVLCRHLAILENQNGWNGRNAIVRREWLVIIHIDFADFEIARQ